MGLLDQYFDPATLEAAKQFGQPSEEDKIRARNAALGQMGFAMMANNRGHSAGQAFGNAFGNGGMAFNQAYQGSLDEAKQNQMQQFKMAGSLQGMQQEAAKRKAQQDAIARLPQDQQQAILAGVPYTDIWKNQNTAYNLGQGERRYQGNTLVAQGEEKPLAPGMVKDAAGKWVFDPGYVAGKKEIASAGANRMNVNMPPMESEEQKALGKDLADQYSTTQKTALSSSGLLNKLNRAEQLMQGINTGKLAPAATEVAALAESFGIKLDPKLPQKQAFSALSNELALRAKNAGGENLMPGAMSEADRTFLQQMSPSMTNTPEGNRLIIETNKRLAKRDIEIAKMARDYRNKNRTLNGFAEELASFSDKNPLFNDFKPAATSSVRSQADAILGGK